jgi:NhaA family Na+:H+ antiporter
LCLLLLQPLSSWPIRLREGYETLLKYKTAGLSVEHWINDALMAVFFMMVGLEIKRELVTGQLATGASVRCRALPHWVVWPYLP